MKLTPDTISIISSIAAVALLVAVGLAITLLNASICVFKYAKAARVCVNCFSVTSTALARL